MKNRVDILNLEWATDSRDTNIVDPVLVSLHDRYGYSVKCSSIWYYLFKLLWYRPKTLIIANDIGAKINVDAFQFAKILGINTVSLISEGLHYQTPDPGEQKKCNVDLFWGNNFEHQVIWDLKLLWSEKLLQEILRDVDGADGFQLKVSGGTGFDKYKLISKEFIRDGFGEEYKKKYKKIIALIGHGFDTLKPNLESNHVNKTEITSWYELRHPVREIYEEIIKRNPDILFILKHHPGSTNLGDTEFAGLNEKYENTVEYHRGIDIAKIICLSDIIIAFESTVCMESWFLDKTTLLINPEGTKFTRSNLYGGSLILNTARDLQSAIDEFYEKGKIEGFESIAGIRKNIIRDQVQFDDGANYLRAAKLINDFIKEKDSEFAARGISLKNRIKVFRELLRETVGVLIEYTPFGFLRKKGKKTRRDLSSRYIKENRKKSIFKYKKGIKDFERRNNKLVANIVKEYTGQTCVDLR